VRDGEARRSHRAQSVQAVLEADTMDMAVMIQVVRKEASRVNRQ
jgi:hypothetical protein